MGGLVQFVALVGFIPTSFSMMRMNSGLDHIVQEEMVINGMRSNGGPPQPRTSSLVNSPLFSRFFTGRDDDGRGSFPRPPMPRQPSPFLSQSPLLSRFFSAYDEDDDDRASQFLSSFFSVEDDDDRSVFPSSSPG